MYWGAFDCLQCLVVANKAAVNACGHEISLLSDKYPGVQMLSGMENVCLKKIPNYFSE